MISAVMEFLSSIAETFALSLAAKAAVIAILALLGMRVLERCQASVRHLVLAGAFVVLLGLPFGALFAPVVEVHLTLPHSPSIATAVTSMLDNRGKSDGVQNISPVQAASREGPFRAAHDIALLWILGTVVFLLPILAGFWQLHRIRKYGVLWLRGNELARDIGAQSKTPVVVLMHGAIRGPMTCGTFRPAIVFPPEAQDWSEVAVRQAMVHEFEHIRRRDCLTHVFSRSVCALYWFNPLIWMCRRRLILEAERACDDAVLKGADATEYASQLVGLARRIGASASGAVLGMASTSELANRVAAILDRRQQRGRAGRGTVVTALISSLVLTVVFSPLRIVNAVPISVGQTVAFEVASVKRDNSEGGGPNIVPQAGGRFVAANATLTKLIAFAYAIHDFQIVGGPAWVSSDRWSVEARAEADSIPLTVTRDSTKPGPFALRLQSLLADRFGLKLHRATQDRPVYQLAIAPTGLKMKLSEDQTPLNALKLPEPAKPGGPIPRGMLSMVFGGGQIEAGAVPLSDFAGLLSLIMDRTVIDRTGLTGLYDFKLNWTPDAGQKIGPLGPLPQGVELPPEDPSGPSIFTALQDQLGLRMQSARGPVDMLVIDNVSRPLEN
jgi:bla regulator protein BlaR1